MENYRKLIGSITIITFSYAASRVLGFFREILLANWAGVSEATDTLDLAFIIPDFLFYLSAGGYLAITLIPIMSGKEKSELNNYFISIFYGLSVIFVLFSLITYSLRFQFAELLGVKSLDFFIEVFTPIIFSQVFFFVGAILMSYQYFHDNFKYAALAPVVYNSTIILFGWLNSSTPEGTIKGFATGTLVGSVIGHFLIQIYGAKKSGLNFNFTSPRYVDLKEYITISLPLILGQSIAVVDEQLFRVFGSFLAAGSVATFRYARRIALLPVGIVAQAVGVASYPLLSRLFQKNDIDELLELVKKQLSYLFLIGSSLMVVAIINAEYLIEIIYERGAFTGDDTIRVSSVFKIISLAIVPWSINQILTRSYYVQQRFWFPVVTGSFITILSSIVLLNAAKDAESYAWIIIISLYIYCLTLLSSLKFSSESVLNKKLFFEFFKILLMVLIVYFVCEIIISLNGLLNLIISLGLTIVVIFVSLSLLNFEYINITKRR